MRDHKDPASAFHAALSLFEQQEFDAAVDISNATAPTIRADCKLERKGEVADVVCSVIVTTHRHSTDLEKLALYLHRLDPGTYEVVFVNNGNESLEAFASEHLDRYLFVTPGFNYGCSGGRNLGAQFASGTYIAFVDDDGCVEPGALEHLLETIQSHHAVAVRGRIRPRRSEDFSPPHYDRGAAVIPSPPDAEGFSVWKRDAFLEFGMFDPLLFGHEGLLLMGRMYRFFGPAGFLYTPHATLQHEFDSGPEQREAKHRRYTLNHAYLAHRGVDVERLLDLMDRARFISTARQEGRAPSKRKARLLPQVSVIATAADDTEHLPDFTRALKAQSHDRFELIAPNDGLSSEVHAKLSELWEGDDRFRPITSTGGGRATALNVAVANAKHDICVIANSSTISAPWRLEESAALLKQHPQLCCVAFGEYNETDPLLEFELPAVGSISVKARSLLRAPAPIAALAFRKSDFTLRIEPAPCAVADIDWLYRNLQNTPKDGLMVPLPAVYRWGASDINLKSETKELGEATLSSVCALHAKLLGEPDANSMEKARTVCGLSEPSGEHELAEIWSYLLALLERLDGYPGCDRAAAAALFEKEWVQLRMRSEKNRMRPNEDFPAQRDTEGAGYPGLLRHLGIRSIVGAFSSEKALRKFDRNPKAFFADMFRKRLG